MVPSFVVGSMAWEVGTKVLLHHDAQFFPTSNLVLQHVTILIVQLGQSLAIGGNFSAIATLHVLVASAFLLTVALLVRAAQLPRAVTISALMNDGPIAVHVVVLTSLVLGRNGNGSDDLPHIIPPTTLLGTTIGTADDVDVEIEHDSPMWR
jgi:hypothetical protein